MTNNRNIAARRRVNVGATWAWAAGVRPWVARMPAPRPTVLAAAVLCTSVGMHSPTWAQPLAQPAESAELPALRHGPVTPPTGAAALSGQVGSVGTTVGTPLDPQLGIPHGAQWAASPAAESASTAAAANPHAATAALQEVRVNAARIDPEAPTLTTPVSVLDADELARRDTATLGAALAGEPGIQATHFGAGASRPVMRGMDGARVKVLANGAPVQDAATVSPDHAVAHDPMLAERIEVLRGPSALVHSAGAMGGVVNVVDGKIPTAIPAKGVAGEVALRAGSAARDGNAAFSLTGGAGQLAVHVEGIARDAGEYRVGSGWREGRKVAGSQSRGKTGSVGVSWIGAQGFIGLSATRQTAVYGLPGHSHAHSDCHPHGTHLHCGGHGGHAHSLRLKAGDHDGHHDDHDDHGDHGDHDGDHDHAHDHGVPRVHMASNRYDLRGEWRQPIAGIDVVRIRGGLTRYRHDEREDGTDPTRFDNRANDWRIEAQHAPIAGWQGLFGLEGSQRRFKAGEGASAYVQPTTTQQQGLFWLEEKRFGNVGVSATLRHDWQRVRAQDAGTRTRHSGTSFAVGANWRVAPEYRITANLSTASRLPTAEELHARGMHLATSTYEIGNANLRAERSRNIDVGLAKTVGDTRFAVNLFHNRIGNYIHGETLDAQDGVQLMRYTQSDARFTGLEVQASHDFEPRWLGARWRAGVWGDVVNAKLANGNRVPRIAPARVGLKLGANWARWGTEAEWVQVKRQNKVAAFEGETAGYGMLNWQLTYRSEGANGQPWQAFVQVNNLTNKLGYAHTSVIKHAAPLAGRNVVVGVKAAF